VPLVFQPCTRQKYVVPAASAWLWPEEQLPPAVWLVEVTEQVITQPGQLVALGSVGRVPLLVATVNQ
jgi:hypothetical protein